jgi:hypothetical protein
MALIPGVSRSGGTITVALLLGLTREAAARFSFLLAFRPCCCRAFTCCSSEPMTPDQWGMTLAATFIAFAVGYAVIVWFMRLISHKGFTFFVVYRVVLLDSGGPVLWPDSLTFHLAIKLRQASAATHHHGNSDTYRPHPLNGVLPCPRSHWSRPAKQDCRS